MKAKLDSLLAQANIQVSEQQKDQLIELVNLLNKWNKAYNLIFRARSARNVGEAYLG